MIWSGVTHFKEMATLKSYLDIGCTCGNHNKTPVYESLIGWIVIPFSQTPQLFPKSYKNLLWQWTGKWMKWPGHFTLSGCSFQRMKFHKHWLTTIWSWSGNFYEMTGRWKSGDTMRHGVFWRCLSSIIFKRGWFKLACIAINFGWIIIGTKN